MTRSLEEIKVRLGPINGNQTIINLVAKSSSPTAAYEMIIAQQNDLNLARAGRWLAILRRDHFEEYQKIISNQVTLQKQDNGGNEKNEKTICKRFKEIIRRSGSFIAWMDKREKEPQ